jgi:hypothetical protein
LGLERSADFDTVYHTWRNLTRANLNLERMNQIDHSYQELRAKEKQRVVDKELRMEIEGNLIH